MTAILPAPAEAKAQAKRIREKLASRGTQLSHSEALELVSRQYGYRDWNTFLAAMGNQPSDIYRTGARVSGRYLGQPFQATVVGAARLQPGWFRISLDFDEAVDVVAFDSFSNFRSRISGIVGPAGKSKEKTSDGEPHLVLDL